MKDTILLITASYPYGSGETFIDNELPLLCDTYDVAILTSAIPSSNTMRSLPASAWAVAPPPPPRSRLRRIIHGIANIHNLKHMSPGEWRRCFGSVRNAYRCVCTASRIADLRKAIRRVLASTQVDLIYTYWFDVGTLAALIEREKGRVRCEVVTRAHRYDLYPEQQGGWIPLRDWAVSVVDAVFCIAEHGRDTLVASYPEQAAKITCCQLGTIDHGRIDWPASPEKDLPLRVVSLSNLVPVKRIDLLINTLSRLETIIDRPLAWMHIGDGPLRQELEELAHLSLNRTQWELAGSVSNTEVYDLIKQFAPDLLVSTSDSEGLPVSMMESISLGVPVVARDVGGNSEIVKDGVTGFLVGEPAVESIAEAISQWDSLSDSDKIAMRQGARQFWERQFDTSARTKDFINHLSRFVDSWSQR